MEDAHIAIADLNTIAEEVEDSATPVSLFGVFDGHGGTDY